MPFIARDSVAPDRDHRREKTKQQDHRGVSPSTRAPALSMARWSARRGRKSALLASVTAWVGFGGRRQ